MKLNLQIEVKTPFIIQANDTLSSQFSLYKENNNIAYLIDVSKIHNKLSELSIESIKSGDYDTFFDKLQSKYRDLANSNSLPYFKNKINLNLEEDIFSKNYEINAPISITKNLNDELYVVPYISGSSLKGAIENSILYKYLKENEKDIKNSNCKDFINRNHVDRALKSFFYNIIVEDFYPLNNPSIIDNFQLGIYRNTNVNYYNSSKKKNLNLALLVEKGKFNGSIKMRENWKIAKRDDFRNDFTIFSNFLNISDSNSILDNILNILDEFTKNNIKFIQTTYKQSNFLKYINISSDESSDEFNKDKYYLFLGSGKGLYLNSVASLCSNRKINTFSLLSSKNGYIKQGLLKISKI